MQELFYIIPKIFVFNINRIFCDIFITTKYLWAGPTHPTIYMWAGPTLIIEVPMGFQITFILRRGEGVKQNIGVPDIHYSLGFTQS
jgi:hypothetical protein